MQQPLQHCMAVAHGSRNGAAHLPTVNKGPTSINALCHQQPEANSHPRCPAESWHRRQGMHRPATTGTRRSGRGSRAVAAALHPTTGNACRNAGTPPIHTRHSTAKCLTVFLGSYVGPLACHHSCLTPHILHALLHSCGGRLMNHAHTTHTHASCAPVMFPLTQGLPIRFTMRS